MNEKTTGKSTYPRIVYDFYEPDYLHDRKIVLDVVNHYRGRGLNYFNFLDLRGLTVEPGNSSTLNRLTRIIPHGNGHAVVDNNGLIIDFIPGDPFVDPKTIEKFTTFNRTNFTHEATVGKIHVLATDARRNGEEVIDLIAYRDIRKLYEKYGIEYDSPWMEYEWSVNKVCYLLDKEKHINEAVQGLRDKIKDDIRMSQLRKIRVTDILEYINNNPHLTVTVEDSVAAGNCEVGTKRFRDKYFPGRDEVRLEELAQHVNDYTVQRVIKNLMIKTA